MTMNKKINEIIHKKRSGINGPVTNASGIRQNNVFADDINNTL